jgi:hypothetical protein
MAVWSKLMSTILVARLIEEALDLAFYRNIFTSTVIFTCLTHDHCTDEYTSVVVQRLIDSGTILYELLPLYLDKSLENRTITCLNTSNDEIPCYGGFCQSITQETISWWSYHDCEYPSELSALSSTELTSLTAFFFKFEPENQLNDQVNDNKMTLLCNVDFCNGIETRKLAKLSLDRYNLAVFNFTMNSTTSTTLIPLTSTTVCPTTHTTASQTTNAKTSQSKNTTTVYGSSSQESPTTTFSSTLACTIEANQVSTGKSLTMLIECSLSMLNSDDFQKPIGIKAVFLYTIFDKHTG